MNLQALLILEQHPLPKTSVVDRAIKEVTIGRGWRHQEENMTLSKDKEIPILEKVKRYRCNGCGGMMNIHYVKIHSHNDIKPYCVICKMKAIKYVNREQCENTGKRDNRLFR